MSAFVIEKGAPGMTVSRDIEKLGYKGVETCELHFADFPVPAENLIGGVEGQGFKQVMTGLEAERINVAARGLGIARAAFRRRFGTLSAAPRSANPSQNIRAFRSSLPIWLLASKPRGC